ncbi:hypothetical protein NC315_08745 [Streptomyces sp. G2]|uniref:hypothetical protein n=1 Tax=Streptomyces sp. G2 TaxID=1684471 RepID=UPI00202E8472|nr:hypothetical protein [Streptomyces sp. G2]MCM1945461.1 hypothetical protein [Streptomyces sp. G2]
MPLCRKDHRAYDATHRRLGIANLAEEVERLRALAWERETSEKREFQARHRAEQIDLYEDYQTRKENS